MAIQEHLTIQTIEKRIKNPLENRETRSIGLSFIAATHGTSVAAVERLLRDGRFSGGTSDPSIDSGFHVTPNVHFKDWRKTAFANDIARVAVKSDKFPIDISMDYAETNEESEDTGGVVLGFDGRVLPLVRLVDMDDMLDEPEVVLHEAPPIESVRAIFPMDRFALSSLRSVIEKLR